MSAMETVMRLEIVCGAVVDPCDPTATMKVAPRFSVHVETRHIEVAPAPAAAPAQKQLAQPESTSRRQRKLTRVERRWGHDKRVVFERTRNARNLYFTRFNIVATLRNLGLSMEDLLKREWTYQSLEYSLKVACRMQDAHAKAERLADERLARAEAEAA